jgi:hypothetical protein
MATPTRTPTPTATRTPGGTEIPTETPTPSPTPTVQPCGNGLIEPGETCDACPDDCVVLACSAGNPILTAEVDLQAPLGNSPSALAVLVGYRSNLFSLPGSSGAAGARVKNRPAGSSQLVNDLNYAVRVVMNAPAGGTLPNAQIFTIDFDTCAGAPTPMSADLACTVESCGSSTGTIEGCTCSITLP